MELLSPELFHPSIEQTAGHAHAQPRIANLPLAPFPVPWDQSCVRFWSHLVPSLLF